jgi:hypothetical protein|tara:strand:+ start:123 stop:473 length:351 start_codon:yes stop_codon:yes gene_type:complete
MVDKVDEVVEVMSVALLTVTETENLELVELQTLVLLLLVSLSPQQQMEAILMEVTKDHQVAVVHLIFLPLQTAINLVLLSEVEMVETMEVAETPEAKSVVVAEQDKVHISDLMDLI